MCIFKRAGDCHSAMIVYPLFDPFAIKMGRGGDKISGKIRLNNGRGYGVRGGRVVSEEPKVPMLVLPCIKFGWFPFNGDEYVDYIGHYSSDTCYGGRVNG